MIEVRRPRAEDFLALRYQPADFDVAVWYWEHAEYMAGLRDETARTVLLDDEPCGIGGILHTGEAWTILSQDCRRVMPVLVRVVRRAVRWYGLHVGTVYAIIDETRPECVRWAGLLGLTRQSAGVWIYRKRELETSVRWKGYRP